MMQIGVRPRQILLPYLDPNKIGSKRSHPPIKIRVIVARISRKSLMKAGNHDDMARRSFSRRSAPAHQARYDPPK